MSETIITRGIILKEQTIGERDRLATILTEDIGLIHAFVNGAKSARSKKASATDLFCFSKLTIVRSKSNVFSVKEASVIEVFFSLRQNVVSLALAQYISEIAFELSPREQEAKNQLRLVANAFSLLCSGTKPHEQIKAVAELRLLTYAGYMPPIVACDSCGAYESPSMSFDAKTGRIWCQNCTAHAPKNASPAGLGVISAMRHICFSDDSKIFSFSLQEESLSLLSLLSEGYLRNVTGRKYNALDFYRELVI